MIKKWFFRLFLGFALIVGAIGSFFYFGDDLKVKQITSNHSPRQEWEVSPLSEFEKAKIDEILGQTFTFTGEGGQSFVFVSDDGNYVLKLFKFKRFRPSALVKLLPEIELFADYRQQHTIKRENKWLAAFNGHKLAYDLNRRNSGLVHIKLNAGDNKKVRLIDKWGFRRLIDLEKIPYVLQVKAKTLGDHMTTLLSKGKVDEAKEKINQLFHLYLTEYRKGIYDVDYGIMHNIGVVDDRLIHLDVGKMVYDERMKRKANTQYDLTKVATKVHSWVGRKHPKYSDQINAHMEERLTALFGKKFTFPNINDIEENKNLFASDIYSHYAHQRKEFMAEHPLYSKVKDSSDKTMVALLDLIEMPLGNPHEQRQNHVAIVLFMRKGISEQLSPDSKQLFTDLVRWTYLQANTNNDEKNFLFEHGGSESNNLFRLIPETYLMVKEDPQFNSIKNLSSYEDQLLEGNLPTKIGIVNQTELIRMGQPLGVSRTFTRWFTSPTVTPEFLYFVQNQPSHLYVNLMKRQGTEKKLTRTLEKLEEDVQGLSVVTLDKDSDFYWQKNNNLEFVESDLFITDYLQHLQSDHYYWTKKLDPDEWHYELRHLIHMVQHQYFKDRQILGHTERKDFIELSYLAILDRLVEKIAPTSMNITCRQAIDRAPSLIALWMLQKREYNDRDIAGMLLAPPLVDHNRPSHDARVARFLSAAHKIRN